MHVHNKSDYEIQIFRENLKDLCNSKQFIIFAAWTNTWTLDWIFKNKIYNWQYEADQSWIYSLPSLSNSDKNNYPNSHLLVTIATNKDGDFDHTKDLINRGSNFPIWFKNDVLFAWRQIPYHSAETWLIWASEWNYATSLPNYLNVAMMDLCFQMYAEVEDVDKLLEMVRSTCDTDYIRLDLNGDGDTNDNVDGQSETQALQLMNPAKFFKKYLMPKDIPSSIQPWQTMPLEKWYYKWVIFDIPGAEVLIDGQWLVFGEENKDRILSHNPMEMEWRLNGTILRKLGYTAGQTIQGQILTVDDQWNGLRLEKPLAIRLQ